MSLSTNFAFIISILTFFAHNLKRNTVAEFFKKRSVDFSTQQRRMV